MNFVSTKPTLQDLFTMVGPVFFSTTVWSCWATCSEKFTYLKWKYTVKYEKGIPQFGGVQPESVPQFRDVQLFSDVHACVYEIVGENAPSSTAAK